MDFLNSQNQKVNNVGIAVGFDLTDSYSQISYGYVDSDKVETLSTIAGGSDFLIPTVLFKRKEVNQWFAGKEALDNRDTDGYLVENILSRGVTMDEIPVGNEAFRPSALIALFMKRTLSLLSMSAPLSKIVSFMITVDYLDDAMIKILNEAVASLGLKNAKIYYQSHMESFYYFAIYQDAALWKNDVVLFDFSMDVVKLYRMECNRNTTPIVAFIDSDVFTGYDTENLKEVEPGTEVAKKYDEDILEVIKSITSTRAISSVYLIGDAFNKDVFKESVRLLCRAGRVFEGNNLYSKGAAHSARDKVSPSILSSSHVFLGNDKLKSNVGINVLKMGTPCYMPLLDAGINWFEAQKECDVILNQGNKISFVITPLTGKNPEVVDITLADLPKRPAKTSKIHLTVKMISENRMQVNVKDLGFGELFPASDIEWKEVVLL